MNWPPEVAWSGRPAEGPAPETTQLLASDITAGETQGYRQVATIFFFFLIGGSQDRGRIGAGAATAGLGHSHSDAGSKPHLGPTPQLPAMLDP